MFLNDNGRHLGHVMLKRNRISVIFKFHNVTFDAVQIKIVYVKTNGTMVSLKLLDSRCMYKIVVLKKLNELTLRFRKALITAK